MKTQAYLACATLVSCAGCVSRLFVPDSHDAAQEAKDRERDTCPPVEAPEYPVGLFDPRSVTRVTPLYATVQSGRSGEATHLLGAIVYMKPLKGSSAEFLEALLNCHNARRELDRPGEPAPEEDPYWVRGRKLEIKVRFESSAFRVDVRGYDLETSQEILRRATAFQKPSR